MDFTGFSFYFRVSLKRFLNRFINNKVDIIEIVRRNILFA